LKKPLHLLQPPFVKSKILLFYQVKEKSKRGRSSFKFEIFQFYLTRKRFF
jgi:hypothetical protein